MIRELFTPRAWLVFFAIYMFCLFGTYAWVTVGPEKHREWIKKTGLPILSAVVALILTIGFVTVITFFE